jgi:hypothetical protein
MTTKSFAMAAALIGLLGTFSTVAVADTTVRIGRSHHDGGLARSHDNRGNFNQRRNYNYNDDYDNSYRRHNRQRGFGFGGITIDLGGNSGCGYSYRKWQATGSRYWRERYYDCVS